MINCMGLYDVYIKDIPMTYKLLPESKILEYLVSLNSKLDKLLYSTKTLDYSFQIYERIVIN